MTPAPAKRVVVATPIATSHLAALLDGGGAGAPRGEGAVPVTRIVGGLLAREVPVTVVTCTRELSPGEEVVVRGPLLTIRYGCWRGGPAARDIFRVERDHVARSIEAEGVDLVNAHWNYEYALGALQTGVPTIVTAHDWAPAILRYDRSPYRIVRLGMQLASLRRADHVITNSPYLAKHLSRVTRSDVPALGIPIDESSFGPDGRQGPSAAPLLVAASQGWGKRKNVATLLRAMPAVHRALPTARLRLLGDEYEPGGRASQFAAKHGLSDGVEFVGTVTPDQVMEHMRDADLFVHPAREESFGSVLIEAMAQGTPVIGGKASGAVPWVLDHGRAGVLVDVSKPDEWAQAIIGVLGDQERWHGLSTRGRAHAWDNFRTGRVAEKYAELYEAVRRLTTIPQN